MNFTVQGLLPSLPELFVLSMTTLVLIFDLFSQSRLRFMTYYVTQLTVIGAIAIVLAQYHMPSVVTFSGAYIHDQLASLSKLFILIIMFSVFLYSRAYIRERHMQWGEFHVLALFSMLGMLAMVSAHNLISIYLSLELLSLPLYALVAMRRQQPLCTEAAMKYFVMGALASGMLLYGMSMLYGATGSIDIDTINTMISQTPSNKIMILSFGLVFIVAGLGFKLAAAPFHMWAPDVYQGAPTAVTLLLSTAPKIAVLGLIFRLLVSAMPELHSQWQQLLIVLSILSMLLGNIIAIVQSNLKRLFAYSAIAHMGYMLLGLIAGTEQGYSAALFYMLTYGLTALAGFGILVLLSHFGLEIENISDLRGLNQRNPWIAFLMLLVLFSMAGVPPTVGFIAKLVVLKALVNAGMIWLPALALIFAIIGAYYYIRVVKVMYFENADDLIPFTLQPDLQLVISVNGLALLILGIFPTTLLHYSQAAFGI